MEELYEQNAKIVFHFLCSICHDENLAEELTQETFLQAFQSLERYDGSCKISTWFCQIAKHLYYQYLRKYNRELPTEIEEQAEARRSAHYLLYCIKVRCGVLCEGVRGRGFFYRCISRQNRSVFSLAAFVYDRDSGSYDDSGHYSQF